jgi:hypothetical protein
VDMHSLVRTRAFTLAAVVLVLGGLVAGVRLTRAEAADPSEGTIGEPPGTSVTWVGQHYTAAATIDPNVCPPPADPENLLCDHFFLTVDVTPDYWDTHEGGARVTITWADDANDFDMYIYDENGNEVTFSAAGGTTSEEVLIQDASGLYEVRVNPFLVVDSGYDGVAVFESEEGGPPPNPTRRTGGMRFGPATVVDLQRTEGEPLNHIDPADGAYWESGPWGVSTQQSFVHRSTDGGDSFHVVSPIQLRPDAPPGGGDTDVVLDDQGVAYFVDLEGLVNLGAAVSHDDGNSWTKNPFSVQQFVDDRQWFALDNGPTNSADDNTVFLAFRQVPLGSFIYSTPGSTGPADPVGGLVYTDASSTPGEPVSNGAPCGQTRFDPVHRNLYYPCSAGDHVEITVGHVDPGQRTGIEFTNVQAPVSPGGAVGDIFPAVAVDRTGNVYAVWVDEIDHNVYYAASTDQGQTWGPVHQINGNDANSNVFPWAVGGRAGTLAVAWYGSSSHLDSDSMPSWYNDRMAATAYPWFGYVSVIGRAAGETPSFAQQQFTRKPMHYGEICNEGLGCTLSGGDRTMADFMAIYLDVDGSIRVVYNDTTSQHHGAHIFETRQLRGLNPGRGGRVNKPFPTNPMADATGDAQWPHYFPTGAGANLPHLDITRLLLEHHEPGHMMVHLTVDDLSTFAPPPGETNAGWLVRFQARSTGDEGEESYRIFYVGAESVLGQAPTFFVGSGDSAQEAVAGDGCVITTPENCKIVLYPAELAASGSVAGDTITWDVDLQGFGHPIKGRVLYNVTGFTLGRTPGDPLYADVDATRPFDMRCRLQ